MPAASCDEGPVQNLHYLESGRFILAKQDLKQAVSPEDRAALELAEFSDGYDFDRAYTDLFTLCQAAFTRIERIQENTPDAV